VTLPAEAVRAVQYQRPGGHEPIRLSRLLSSLSSAQSLSRNAGRRPGLLAALQPCGSGSRPLPAARPAESICAKFLKLATSRYQAKDLIVASGLVPVGISIGKPKFPLGYTPVYMKEAAPWGLREIADNDEFSERYQARLDGIGIDVFQRRFAEISTAHDGRGLVLLCFEPAGQFCHRHLFASWFEKQTGEHVPELEGHEQLRLSLRVAAR
jgi:hypothetical protein